MCIREKQPGRSACPRAAEQITHRRHWWVKWLLPAAGLASLVWFLIRVIPKPSRATYPCQRVVAPLASGFVIWLTGIIGSTLLYRKAQGLLRRSRYVVAGLVLAVAVAALWLPLSVTSEQQAGAAFTPPDPPNSPIGVGKGIHPGRVVWIHEPAATSWDGSTGAWWEDASTDQGMVETMLSQTIRTLTGEQGDAEAWDALFGHFNQTRDLGDVGYQQGEKVTIKINMNQDSGGSWGAAQGMPSPQALYALLDQLINVVGVPGEAITVYDASRYIGDPIYDKVRANPDADFQAIRFVVRPNLARSGRVAARWDPVNPFCFADRNIQGSGTGYPPRCVTGAKYLINMALLRAHQLFGVTLCAKNHFGTTYFANYPTNGGWTPEPLHSYGQRSRAQGSYNCLVDLIGHRHTGGKTLLYLIDALYGAEHQSANVIRFTSFGNDWTSSLFASQDPVAIDSVGLDFLRNEPRATQVTGNVDNYLHEAALANDPPSGTVYDPERDGIPLESLGVHEHWNNAADKQYSRNLGTGDGIELVVPARTDPNGPVVNLATGVRYTCLRYAVDDATAGDEIVAEPGIYRESIDFGGKDLVVRSEDPNDPDVVAATIVDGGSRGVTFSGGEMAGCVLSGVTITGSGQGVYCTGASPTISHCCIVANRGAGVKLWNKSNPTISNCVIAGNGAAGIEMWADKAGRFVKNNYATITNCTIVGNFEHGIYGGYPTVSNCIVYYNGRGVGSVQIHADWPSVSYSNVEYSLAGTGNINGQPCFVVPGHWDGSAEPNGVWVAGDYHLRWDSPCVDAGDPGFVSAQACDMDGEPRVIGDRVDMGCDEVGPKQADFTRDGAIDARDVEVFVEGWLGSSGDANWGALCDLYEDGHIDLADWARLSGDWLWQSGWHQP